MKHRVSPAMVVALIALFVALGGTAYAATKLPRNSVTTIQVKDRSLLSKDFKAGQIPRGPAGPPGATNVQTRSNTVTPAAYPTPFAVTAQCQDGERATGGGWAFVGGIDNAPEIFASAPEGNGWRIYGRSKASGAVLEFRVFVMCASP